MPIYEYRRLTDGEVIEVIQKPGEAPLVKCPETGDPVEKLISRSAFQLKGAGWYVSDYKAQSNDSSAAPKKENTETTADSTSSSEASSEGKAAPVSEAKAESSTAKSSSEPKKTVKTDK